MISIPLTGKYANGRSVIVDDEDADLASLEWWMPSGRSYPKRMLWTGRGTRAHNWLHRTILMRKLGLREWPKGAMADHIDRDPLNCRRANLRMANATTNARNKTGYKNNTTGYRGVNFYRGRRYAAHLRVDGLQIHLGYYPTALEAAYIRDQVAIQLHGDYAALNVL